MEGRFMDIRNLYFVGRNYAQHAQELGNDVPIEPIVFMKPSHAVVPMDGREVVLDGTRGEIHYEAELVVRIGQPYAANAAPDSLITGLALGLDMTLRDVQAQAKRQGLPWLDAKGFPRSAIVTEWQSYPGSEILRDMRLSLQLNGREVQSGYAREMIFGIADLVTFIGERFGLGPGDVIFTGTPAGVGPVADGDLLECFLDGKPAGSCRMTLTV
jgi:fumarylpyruvate hydrolase